MELEYIFFYLMLYRKFCLDPLSFLRECPCAPEHLLLTQNLCKKVASDANDPMYLSSEHRRYIVGLLPLPLNQSNASSRIRGEAQTPLLILFASKPEVVTIFVPITPLPLTSSVVNKHSTPTVAIDANQQINDGEDDDPHKTQNNSFEDHLRYVLTLFCID